MSPGKVLVIGGTGHYGRPIVHSLQQAGAEVRVLTRNAERAREALGLEIDAMQGDLTSSASRAEALHDVDRLVISVAANNRKLIRRRLQIERDAVLAVLDEVGDAGVRRVVYLSGYEMREEFARDLGLLDFARPQLDVEAALRNSNLNWTVLGCAASMEIFFTLIRGDVLNVPGGGPPALPTVSARDVGQVAARAVLRDDLAKRRFRLPGPEAISFPEAARRIGAAWGRLIRFRRIPLAPLRLAAFLTRPALLPAYSCGAVASPLVVMLLAGHQDVRLDQESLDRIVTWIDLNVPYYDNTAVTRPSAVRGRLSNGFTDSGRAVIADARPTSETSPKRSSGGPTGNTATTASRSTTRCAIIRLASWPALAG